MKKLIKEYMYWLGTVKISNFLNSLVHEVLGCAPTTLHLDEISLDYERTRHTFAHIRLS